MQHADEYLPLSKGHLLGHSGGPQHHPIDAAHDAERTGWGGRKPCRVIALKVLGGDPPELGHSQGPSG